MKSCVYLALSAPKMRKTSTWAMRANLGVAASPWGSGVWLRTPDYAPQSSIVRNHVHMSDTQCIVKKNVDNILYMRKKKNICIYIYIDIHICICIYIYIGFSVFIC